MVFRKLIPVVVLILVMAGPAMSQIMRPGEAQVLEPNQPRLVDLSKRYTQAGRPSLMIFWNRRFTDQLQRDTVSTEVERMSGGGQQTASEQRTHGEAGAANLRESENTERRTTTRERTTRTADPGIRTQPFTEVVWSRVEASFMTSLGQAGLILVDRTLAMRKLALDETQSEPQRIEGAALETKARYLVEALAMVDRDAPFGASFRIVVKDVKEGRLLVDRVTRGEPEDVVARRLTYYTTNNAGFKKVDRMEREAATPEDLGRQLARDFLRELMITL